MTPEEAWSSYKPDVGALRMFGCVAYAYVPVEKRKKFDGKGVNAFSLVIVIELKVISCLIQQQVKLL